MPSSTIFPDQSHIGRIRDALWSRPGNGASVMVGSGFSRSAIAMSPGSGAIPLLPEIKTKMANRLYPQIDSTRAPSKVPATNMDNGILRLAQEYETAFGRSDLHQFLQQLVRDADYRPGEAHSRLLALPWSDVFTTNWDTLLEQASSEVLDRAYSVVRDVDEIPLANKPRIVKLHGSLPAQFPLIFTEEDYRTYPTKFAPFVNTVQQGMMETVFCLIGFSGDDPNFLHWSGWVRDNLGTSAPKIYLAGWLDLSQHRRQLLQDRGVVPIDLAGHPRAREWPEHLRYRYAIEWVLHTLERGCPYDVTYWPAPVQRLNFTIPDYLQPVVEFPSQQPQEEPGEALMGDEDISPDRIRQTLCIWSHNRQMYPGWLVLPSSEERHTLSRNTDYWEPRILAVVPDFDAVKRLSAVRELVWRREILLQPISDELEEVAQNVLSSIDCVSRTIDDVANISVDWSAVREEWRTVALTLVTAARFRFDVDLFNTRIEALSAFVNDDIDVYHRLQQERCLWAIYLMDLAELESLLEDWTVQEGDPIWMVRKAAFIWELGRNDEASLLVKQALSAIRALPDVRGSIGRESRECWALWSALTNENRNELRRRWDELAGLRCDADLERDLIAREVSDIRGRDEVPTFDLTVRRIESVSFSSDLSERAAHRAVRLSEVAGLPPTTHPYNSIGMDIAAEIFRGAALKFATKHFELSTRLVLRASNSETEDTLNLVLSRTRIATLSSPTVKALTGTCVKMIQQAFHRIARAYERQSSLHWITRMRVALETLSRLALRAEPEDAETFLEIGLKCYSSRETAQELWLHKSIGNLLRRSWEALPSIRRTARTIDILGCPIVGMDGLTSVDSHLNDPAEFLQLEELPATRTAVTNGQWDSLVKLLVRGLKAGREARSRAAGRILLMSDRRLLTEAESTEVAKALWCAEHLESQGMPGGTSLFDWMFLVLPEPSPGYASQRFRLKWLSGDTAKLQDHAEHVGDTISITFGTEPRDPDRIEHVLCNVGSALSGLSRRGKPLVLTDDERDYIRDIVRLWGNADNAPPSVPFFQESVREPTRWALHGIAAILTEGIITEHIGELLYEKVKVLGESGTPGFEVVSGLVRTLPYRADELADWLRLGIVSSEESVALSAIAGLYSWIAASSDLETTLRPPPEDMLRELGLIVASRRTATLSQALELANEVFRNGTQQNRDVLAPLVLQGLGYLAEELSYSPENAHEGNTDIARRRWLCARLAQSMAQSGLQDEPVVALWLRLSREDPLPEVRFAVASTSYNDTSPEQSSS